MAVRELALKEAQAGMLTAEAVMDAQGRVLIPADFRLTPMQIACLGRWGVQSLHVHESDAGGTPPPAGTPVAEASPPPKSGKTSGPSMSLQEFHIVLAAELDERFSDVLGDPLMAELKNSVRRRLLARTEPLPGTR